MNRGSFALQARMLIVPGVTFLLLLSCAAPDVLIIRDQYWRVISFDSTTEEEILERSKKRGKKVGYLDLDYPANAAEIVASISQEDPEAVVLSPLFSHYAEEISKQENQRRIVAFGLGTGTAVTNDNLTVVVFDRIDAYRRAGLLCRQYLEYPENDEMRVEGLFYSGGDERTAEREAFEKGVGDEFGDRFSTKAFPRLNDIGEVNDYLSGLADQAIGIFFVSMSGFNRDVISSIVARYQSLIITERLTDVGNNLPYQDRALATIDEGWTEIFSLHLSGAGPEIVVEASLLPGPAAFSPSASWVRGFFRAEESG